MNRREFLKNTAISAASLTATGAAGPSRRERPNLLFILTDDQRHDAMRCAGNPLIVTPHMDSLARSGVRFSNAIVATSVCSASRACCLTGRYGSANGVPGLKTGMNPGEVTFAQRLKSAGYQTGYVGKWHLKRPKTPNEAGFDFDVRCWSNGPHFGRKVVENGREKVAKGFIEDYFADQSIRFLESVSKIDAPFFLHLSTQVPHMDHRFQWVPRPDTLALYDEAKMPLPESWRDDLAGKPPYLKTGRHRAQAEKYGYKDAAAIRRHFRSYYGAITEMDRSLGRVLAALDRLGVRDNTYIIFMGDNGWFMGEHGFTSKLLPYEESIRVPFILSGPNVTGRVSEEFVLNADIAPTFLELAGVPVPDNMHGRSLLPFLNNEKVQWRRSVLYEALDPDLGSWPLVAVRTRRWKYIQTFDLKTPSKLSFEELYDLQNDPNEMKNLAGAPEHKSTQNDLTAELNRLRKEIRDV